VEIPPVYGFSCPPVSTLVGMVWIVVSLRRVVVTCARDAIFDEDVLGVVELQVEAGFLPRALQDLAGALTSGVARR
jgi:hypothetical protein